LTSPSSTHTSSSEAAVVVVVASIAFNLGDGSLIIKVMDCFAESMVGERGSLEKVVEPGQHRVGILLIEIVMIEEKVNDVSFLIMALACKKEDTAIGAKFDPLCINIISLSNGDVMHSLWYVLSA
jgi:hypothetical protein